jgi:vitamin B12 transporter
VMLHVTYFHTQFGRQIEFVDSGDLTQYFGIPIPVSSGIFGAYLNSLDFKAQGFESQIEWRKGNHIFVRGGYTYLDAKVEKSFSGDATSGGLVTTNPDFPNIPIGGTSPLVGARPFRRAPHTGYIVASYTRTKWSAAFKTSLVSNSDDSTFLTYSDFNGGNSLLLPNRNLDFGYTRMDLNANYQVMSRVTVFSQVNNLLGQQHTGPIGYPGLPFNFRTGLKVRLGGQ